MNQVEMNTIKKVVLKEKPKTKKSIDKKLRWGKEFIKKAILINKLAPDKELSDFSDILSSKDKWSVKCSRY